MRPGLFEPQSFDRVTLFQVSTTCPIRSALLRECHAILRPGGVILAFNHNVTAWSARLLGERSPIIDVEHTYLYSPGHNARLFSKAGFEVLSVRPVRNTYSALVSRASACRCRGGSSNVIFLVCARLGSVT